MCMSIERLFSRQCPKSINIDPSASKAGVIPISQEEVLNILGQVQHHQPIGSYVLNAQIADDSVSRKYLVIMLTGYLAEKGIPKPASPIFADAAVTEVCDTNICPKCKGNGEVFSKKFNSLSECSKCKGVGRIILTSKQLYLSINKQLSKEQKITGEDFMRKYYDQYMEAVDLLHKQAGNAAMFTRGILDRLEAA